MSLRLFNGRMRTALLAGFALIMMSSPVKGFLPGRAFVAGFFFTTILQIPGIVNDPLRFRLFPITVVSSLKTSATWRFGSSVLSEIEA